MSDQVRFPGNGFSRRKSNIVVPITECPLLHEKFQSIMGNEHVKDEAWGYDEITGEITQEEAGNAIFCLERLT